MSVIDWSKAPKEATHALTTGPNFNYECIDRGVIKFATFFEGRYIADVPKEDSIFIDQFVIGDNAWVVIDERQSNPSDMLNEIEEDNHRPRFRFSRTPTSTRRTAESSAVKTLGSSPDTMTIGEMVDSGQSVFGGRITQCDDVDNTVTQRGERYGLFADGAVIMQDLKAVMRATPGWERLTPSQREALEMIQHKIGRVLNGDPMYDDSWRDISGYSTLILNELNGVKR